MTERRQVVVASRCFNHPEREASARCTDCGRYYCRECVAEHDGRMICGACLRRERPAAHGEPRRWLRRIAGAAELAAAVVVAWLVFYAAGRVLLNVPSDFHDGTVWRGDWWEEDGP